MGNVNSISIDVKDVKQVIPVKHGQNDITGNVVIVGKDKSKFPSEVELYVVGTEKTTIVNKYNSTGGGNSSNIEHGSRPFYSTVFKLKVPTPDEDSSGINFPFRVRLANDIPQSGKSPEYGNNVGFAISYHVLAEMKIDDETSRRTKLSSDVCHLSLKPIPPSEEQKSSLRSTGSVSFAKSKLLYDIPTILQAGENVTIKLKLEDDKIQRQKVKLRLIEQFHVISSGYKPKQTLLYETEQVTIKNQSDDDDVGLTEVYVAKYANDSRPNGNLVQVKHLFEISTLGGSGGDVPDVVTIPCTVGCGTRGSRT